MNKVFFKAACVLLMSFFSWESFAQGSDPLYVEASELTLVGKLFPDTGNPYHRLDTTVYGGFTKSENLLSRESSGISVAFRTNSKSIRILTRYGHKNFGTNISGISQRGYDLYIRKDGKWLWAAAGVARDKELDKPFTLIKNMDGSMHECLLYLPTFSEEYSVKIGVDAGSEISAMENPFRHRVGIFGSSFTHGASTSKAGMAYPAIFTRDTGIQLLSLGVSGNSKLQPAFARALADADVERICSEVNAEVGTCIPANYNHPGQLVISGTVEAVGVACERLKAAGAKRALPLPVGGAFHSPLMQPAKDELQAAIEATEFQTPKCPIYQNVDGQAHTEPSEIKANLIAQLTASVRWTQEVQAMVAAGATEFTECGPGKALQGMIAKIAKDVTIQGAAAL